LAEEQEDHAAAELAADLATVVREAAQAHGGRPVKWLGDGVVFHFTDPGGAIRSGLRASRGPYGFAGRHAERPEASDQSFSKAGA
jgi:class 3 adenylate cyclase